MSTWPLRERLGFGLGALLTLSLCLGGLHGAPAQLGSPRSCTRAQLVDGRLRCDEELVSRSTELCAQAPTQGLRPGDAIDVAQLCTGAAPRRMAPEHLRALAQTVDLNGASQGELASLPGIGPTLAGRIVAGRPYLALEDLLEVRGIGPKRLAALRARAQLGRRDAARAPARPLTRSR